MSFFFFQAEDGIRDLTVTGVQTCALPISIRKRRRAATGRAANAIVTARGWIFAPSTMREDLMRRSIVVLALVLASASSAHAVPGDARLVQGVLEWPPKLTVEPFVIVRSEDGHWYYVDVNGAKRLESSAITAGARVTVLGTEAARSHEITALALSSGDAAALVLALMSHVSPTPATPAPSPSPTSPIESSTPPTPAVVAPISKSVAKAPATSSPQPHKEKVTAPKTTTPSEPSPPSVTAPARPASTSRWSEVRGAVHSVAGQEEIGRAHV